MKIAFTYNLRLTDVRETEKEAEYDSADTVNAIASARRVVVRVNVYSADLTMPGWAMSRDELWFA